jgi:hypothetical protein
LPRIKFPYRPPHDTNAAQAGAGDALSHGEF